MPSSLPRRTHGCLFRSLPLWVSAFPMSELGRLRIAAFEACSTFTLVTACAFAELPGNPLHRRLQPTSLLDCSDCYRLERESPGGIRTHWKSAPFHGALRQAASREDDRGRRCCGGWRGLDDQPHGRRQRRSMTTTHRISDLASRCCGGRQARRRWLGESPPCAGGRRL